MINKMSGTSNNPGELVSALFNVTGDSLQLEINRGIDVLQVLSSEKYGPDKKSQIAETNRFTGGLRIINIKHNNDHMSEAAVCICEVLGMVGYRLYLVLEREIYRHFEAKDFFSEGKMYLFRDLIINWIFAENICALMFDQGSKGIF